MARVAGVDGCKGGWVVARCDGHAALPAIRIETHLADVLADHELVVVAIDMPMGLLDEAVPGGRGCERAARQFLGRRSSSVFSAPVRACLDAHDHHDACARSRRSSRHRLGISAQSWGITPKIAAIDAWLTPARQGRVVEVHPEVSFAVMNGDRGLAHGKKTKAGRSERAALLARAWGIDVASLVAARHAGAKPDDVLDALAAAWTAQRVLAGTARSFPCDPALDARGLRMQILA